MENKKKNVLNLFIYTSRDFHKNIIGGIKGERNTTE